MLQVALQTRRFQLKILQHAFELGDNKIAHLAEAEVAQGREPRAAAGVGGCRPRRLHHSQVALALWGLTSQQTLEF